MKSKLIYFGLIAILLSGTFYACRKDVSNLADADLDNPDIRLTVAMTKAYLKGLRAEEGNSLSNAPTVAKVSSKPRKKNKKYVILSKAISGEDETSTYVEAPILFTYRSGGLIKDSDYHGDVQTDNKVAMATIDRIIFNKDKRTGKITQRIVSLVPYPEYLAKHPGENSKNTITKISADFTGYKIVRDWKGNYLSATKIKNGKVVRTLSPRSKAKGSTKLGGRTSGEICFDFCYYIGDECDYGVDPELGFWYECWPVWICEPDCWWVPDEEEDDPLPNPFTLTSLSSYAQDRGTNLTINLTPWSSGTPAVVYFGSVPATILSNGSGYLVVQVPTALAANTTYVVSVSAYGHTESAIFSTVN